jgi:hypothetical protein
VSGGEEISTVRRTLQAGLSHGNAPPSVVGLIYASKSHPIVAFALSCPHQKRRLSRKEAPNDRATLRGRDGRVVDPSAPTGEKPMVH